MTFAPAVYAALLDKYRRMRAMRVLHDAGTDHDPRPAMRELAQEFPGALREIDQLPMAVIDGRIDALHAVVQGGVAPSEWMMWMVAYHGLLRAVLRVKRMGLSRDDVPAAVARVHAELTPRQDEPPLTAWTPSWTAQVLRPKDGRLSAWVMDQIAAQHGVTTQAVEQGLFPACERRVRSC